MYAVLRVPTLPTNEWRLVASVGMFGAKTAAAAGSMGQLFTRLAQQRVSGSLRSVLTHAVRTKPRSIRPTPWQTRSAMTHAVPNTSCRTYKSAPQSAARKTYIKERPFIVPSFTKTVRQLSARTVLRPVLVRNGIRTFYISLFRILCRKKGIRHGTEYGSVRSARPSVYQAPGAVPR